MSVGHQGHLVAQPNPLVSTAWLEERLGDDSVVVVEVSSRRSLPDTSVERHVPGARFVYWRDLSWDDTERRFPSPEEMTRRLVSLGVSDDSTIAIVGDPIQYGTYAYWVLAMTGHESRTVLVDGGRQTWLAEGRPLGPEVTDAAVGTLASGDLDESSRIGRDEVLERLNNDGLLLVDARSSEEYSGERVSPPWFEFDHGAERSGRIPGAIHLHFKDLLADDGTFLGSVAMADRIKHLPDGSSDVVVYCRLAHRASLAWFAFTQVLDLDSVRVYDGSWTEWGTIVGYPIER